MWNVPRPLGFYKGIEQGLGKSHYMKLKKLGFHKKEKAQCFLVLFLNLFLSTFLCFQFVGCKGGEAFSQLEEALEDNSLQSDTAEEEEAVEITSFSPLDSPVRVADGVDKTFVVSVNPDAGAVTYAWKLNSALISSQSSSFIQLNGSITDPGLNTLEVTASNSINSASKIFTLYKNTPPQ